jgi:hypothetical protein
MQNSTLSLAVLTICAFTWDVQAQYTKHSGITLSHFSHKGYAGGVVAYPVASYVPAASYPAASYVPAASYPAASYVPTASYPAASYVPTASYPAASYPAASPGYGCTGGYPSASYVPGATMSYVPMTASYPAAAPGYSSYVGSGYNLPPATTASASPITGIATALDLLDLIARRGGGGGGGVSDGASSSSISRLDREVKGIKERLDVVEGLTDKITRMERDLKEINRKLDDQKVPKALDKRIDDLKEEFDEKIDELNRRIKELKVPKKGKE